MNTVFTSATPVTPSNTATIRMTAGLWIGGAGNVAVMTKGGQTTTFTAVPAGTLLPLAVTQVLATGTTATAIVAMY